VDHPLHIGAGVKAPVLVKSVDPDLPEIDPPVHPLNCVNFYIVVDSTGGVYDAKLMKSSGFALVDAAYLSAIREERFRPGTKDGQPVAFDLYMDVCVDPV